jgi:hypothetical protein
MSNFTTFFPSAGGGGGEGSGINSYAPFKVGTADNNPQGYIHSTGVYTNPIDSSVWLKTGNTVIDNASPATYPNAFRTALGWDVGAQLMNFGAQTSGNGRGLVRINNHYWIANSGFSATVYQYTLAGVYTGNSIDTTNEHSRTIVGLTTDGTDLWVLTDYNGAFKYTTAGTYTNNSTGNISNAFSIVYSSGTNSFWIGVSNSTKKINEYTLTGTATGVGLTLASSGSNPPKCLTATGANTIAYQDNGDGKLYERTLPGGASTIVAVDANGNPKTVGSSSTFGLNYDSTDGYHILKSSSVYALGDAGYTVGDSTARTDSSGSAQPLFIKLK